MRSNRASRVGLHRRAPEKEWGWGLSQPGPPPPLGGGGEALADPRDRAGTEGTPRCCLFFPSPRRARTQASHMLTRMIVSLGA
jgi:hypothetical protein